MKVEPVVVVLLLCGACGGGAQDVALGERVDSLENEVADAKQRLECTTDQPLASCVDGALTKRIDDLEARLEGIDGGQQHSGRKVGEMDQALAAAEVLGAGIDGRLAAAEADLAVYGPFLDDLVQLVSAADVDADGVPDELRIHNTLVTEGNVESEGWLRSGYVVIVDPGGTGTATRQLFTVPSYSRGSWLVTYNKARFGGSGGGSFLVYFAETPGGCAVTNVDTGATNVTCDDVSRTVSFDYPLGSGFYTEVSWLAVGRP